MALVVLALVEALTPDAGWFACALLDEVLLRDPRLPWQHVAVPLALVATSLVAVPAVVRRLQRPVPSPDRLAEPRQDGPGQSPG